MRYQFSPSDNRQAATTIVFPAHRVSFVPGINELDDATWNAIKDEPEIVTLVESETIRVLSAPVAPKPVKPESTKTEK